MCYVDWYMHDDVSTKSMFLRNYDNHFDVVLSTKYFFIPVYIVVNNVEEGMFYSRLIGKRSERDTLRCVESRIAIYYSTYVCHICPLTLKDP